MAMANLRSVGAFLSGTNHGGNQVMHNDDIVKKGTLAKRKNMKNRFFVLRRETNKDQPSQLEYYDSEKKFLDGYHPKKKYILKDCFSISRKSDAKNNFMIALYINKDCIALVAQNESEMLEWLQVLQQHRHSGSEGVDGSPRIEYEHVWQVEVQPRSFASTQNLAGLQMACLTNRLLSLVRLDNANKKKEFNLNTIRKCGHVNQFFFIELGRFSPIGCGILWMKTEDPFIAQNMHNIVGNAMNHITTRDNGLTMRERTQSVSDSQREGFTYPPRLRSDSMPASAKGQISNDDNCLTDSHLCHSYKVTEDSNRSCQVTRPQSMYASCGISQSPPWLSSPFGSPGSAESMESNSEGKLTARDGSPELEFDNAYVKMDRRSVDVIQSPKILNYEDKSEYVPMDANCVESKDTIDSHHPKSFTDFSPHASHKFPGTASGSSTPLSPSTGVNCSPETLASLSRMEDVNDGYASMMPPSSFPSELPQMLSSSPSPYLEMGPEKRIASTPTPIPFSPSDGDSLHEMSPSSGSSSLTSETPSSDQRIHELINEKYLTRRLQDNFSEAIDSLDSRPIRTSSVGSKPEQYKRKNRLDVLCVGEPGRVRAFSVGSRVSLKLGLGRHGTPPQTEHPSCVLGDLFTPLKTSKEAKNKSASAPMLGTSSVSHSWSGGTPGSYFRGFIQNRQLQRENNLMELDFSKNKSYDYIPVEEREKERKTSKERLWYTFAAYRQRSNSKSSGGSGSKSEMKSKDSSNYFEIDFNPSSGGDNYSRGYVPMQGSTSVLGPCRSSFSEPTADMLSPQTSCTSQDGYVDMTQGGNSGALSLVSSASIFDNFPSQRPSIVSSQEFSSPLDDFMDGAEVTKNPPRKSKKVGKRLSLKESAKRKMTDSSETSHKSKPSGALSTLTSLISRKTSGPKVPQGGTKSPSPFSSLTRSRSKEPNDPGRCEDSDASSPVSDCQRKGDSLPLVPTSSPTQVFEERKLSESPDISQIGLEKCEEKMMFDPSKPLWQSSEIPIVGESMTSAYMNINRNNTTNVSLSSPSTVQVDAREYVNLQIRNASPPFPPKNSKSQVKMSEEMKNSDAVYSPLLAMDKLALNDKAAGIVSATERSRSHSGPSSTESKGPENSKAKMEEGGRSSSACSSPVSNSPPITPSFGSVSSMSSLSEGGLSSASSTCTVVNVGAQKMSQLPSSTKAPQDHGMKCCLEVKTCSSVTTTKGDVALESESQTTTDKPSDS